MSTQIISSIGGTRTEPKDNYVFVRGTTISFKTTFLSNGVPTTVDTATNPSASIFLPKFLNTNISNIPTIVATLPGSLVAGQEYEYQFTWNIPVDTYPNDEYIIQYEGKLGGATLTFGDEFFTVINGPGTIDIKVPMYATVDDVRMLKFNIDSYLPEIWAKDVTARNKAIEYHLRLGTSRLREELALFAQRGMTENFKLFTTYYAIWSILLAARGEDGSSVSDANLSAWAGEWQRILAQSKRKGSVQSISWGRG